MVSDFCHKYRGISGDISRGLGWRFVFNSEETPSWPMMHWWWWYSKHYTTIHVAHGVLGIREKDSYNDIKTSSQVTTNRLTPDESPFQVVEPDRSFPVWTLCHADNTHPTVIDQEMLTLDPGEIASRNADARSWRDPFCWTGNRRVFSGISAPITCLFVFIDTQKCYQCGPIQ
jgi:hypothetical protein